MTGEEARFEDGRRGDGDGGDGRGGDGAERPLRLRAEEPDELPVISALVQDAVTEAGRASWLPRRRRFTLFLNRFRWEDAERARSKGRPYQRVQSLLVVDGALSSRARGLDPQARDAVLSILAVAFEPAADGAGILTIAMAGGGALALDVECLDVSLVDVSRPYPARSGAPRHAGD